MTHPLHIHGKTSRYGDSIKNTERKYSVSAMMGACEFSIDKYKERLGKKSHINGIIKEALDMYFTHRPEMYESFMQDHLNEIMVSDEKKIETYKAYSDVLEQLLHKGYKTHTVSHALEMEGIVYD